MEKKIQNWLERAIINEQLAQILLKDIKEDRKKARKTKINITIYTIAIILIGLGVITFISANDWILELLNSSKALKIFLMSMTAFGSFFGGYKLSHVNKNLSKLGNALIILSTILIGTTYVLIGQIYHINANSSLLMLLWFISILPIAYIFRSSTVNLMCIILFVLWTVYKYLELSIDDNYIWTIYMPVICGLALYCAGNIPKVLKEYNNFSLTYKIIGATSIFITLFILICFSEESYHTTSPYYILPIFSVLALNILNYVLNKVKDILLRIETIAISVFLLLLLLILILPTVSNIAVMLCANVLIITLISFGYNYGYKFESEKIITTVNNLLTIYIAINYFRWGWSFMDKTLFFILGGTTLLAIGITLEKRKNKLIAKEVRE